MIVFVSFLISVENKPVVDCSRIHFSGRRTDGRTDSGQRVYQLTFNTFINSGKAEAHKSHSTTKLKTMRERNLIDLTRDSSDSDGGSNGNDGAV